MKLPITIILLFNIGFLFSFEDLGPLKDAQKNYPQIFKIGSVNTITINKVVYYCFSGQAEQPYTCNLSLSDSELYQEATLVAKSNLFTFLSKKDKKVNISLSGNQVLYQYNDKNIYTGANAIIVPLYNATVENLSLRGNSTLRIWRMSNKDSAKRILNLIEDDLDEAKEIYEIFAVADGFAQWPDFIKKPRAR
jgi:hypothetical protein